MNVIRATFEEPRGHGHRSTYLPVAKSLDTAALPVAIPLAEAPPDSLDSAPPDPPVDWGDFRPPVPLGRKLGIVLGCRRRDVQSVKEIERPATVVPASAADRPIGRHVESKKIESKKNEPKKIESKKVAARTADVHHVRSDICGAAPIRPSIIPAAAPPINPVSAQVAMPVPAPQQLDMQPADIQINTGQINTGQFETGQFETGQIETRRIEKGQFNLDGSSPVVDAPSIGPRTAERLAAVGIHTVNDLLAADPQVTTDNISYRRINANTIISWQRQAKLVCQIPNLRGHDAQVLVACGFYDVSDLITQEPNEVFRIVGPFVNTKKGERLLRAAHKPDLEEVTNWVNWAASTNRSAAA